MTTAETRNADTRYANRPGSEAPRAGTRGSGLPDADSPVVRALELRFRRAAGSRLLVAFSGGPDSTALLWGLKRIAPARRLDLLAAHLDHGFDDDSSRRAAAARRLASRLGVPLVVERLASAPRPNESLEAYARHRRYEFLERLATAADARFVVTAHHADDQAETVLLRLLYGSGLGGLAGIHPERGRVVRPLLALPRQRLLECLAGSGLAPVSDPTNADLSVPRNRVRERLLPFLANRDPRIVERLCGLARAAGAAGRRSEELLAPALNLRRLADEPGAAVDRAAFEELPVPLRAPALALISRRAGASHPAGAPARAELLRQLAGPRAAGPRAAGSARVGCDCGDGWRWEADSASLRLVRKKPQVRRFAYTLTVPGAVEIPELALRVRLERGDVSSWMFRGRADRTGLAAPLKRGSRVLIRNRRPGDRIQPLGGKAQMRLKDLLIDRRIPRHERDRLPLLVIEDTIAWVPGVTIDERFRLNDERSTWIAEIERI